MENIEDIRRLYIDDLSQESEESRNGYFDLIPAEVAAAQFDAVIRKIQADAIRGVATQIRHSRWTDARVLTEYGAVEYLFKQANEIEEYN